MPTLLTIDISYSQLAVFQSGLEQPFNDWTEQHVAQGFAWRPGSVSFRCMEEHGAHDVEVVALRNSLGPYSDGARRVIEVPFTVQKGGAVEIGSISDLKAVELPEGDYLLRCEFLSPNEEGNERVRLSFSKGSEPHFSVPVRDGELEVGEQLLTLAKPA